MVPGLTLMKQITLKVNSREHTVEVDPDTPLLFVLNDDLGLRGPRFGCGLAQCGYCLSGVILTAKAFLDAKPNASDQEIREALGGILCRCFAHVRMLRAIRKYAEGKKHDSVPA